MKCRTKFCRGVTSKTGHSPYCSKCRSRKWKAVNPLRYSYIKLKNRAKERGHEFTLTFEDYQRFAVETGYDKLKGKEGHSLSINRKDATRGYHADNIEAISLSMNSRLRYWVPPHLREDYERDRKAVAP